MRYMVWEFENTVAYSVDAAQLRRSISIAATFNLKMIN
jgi:hypothetical protein